MEVVINFFTNNFNKLVKWAAAAIKLKNKVEIINKRKSKNKYVSRIITVKMLHN